MGDCLPDLFKVGPANQLNHWLSRFVVEARRADGGPYPSSTLYQLFAGLLRHARCKRRDCLNFLKSNSRFKELRGACDSVPRQLRESGVGADVKHAAVISSSEEQQLCWKKPMSERR